MAVGAKQHTGLHLHFFGAQNLAAHLKHYDELPAFVHRASDEKGAADSELGFGFYDAAFVVEKFEIQVVGGAFFAGARAEPEVLARRVQ